MSEIKTLDFSTYLYSIELIFTATYKYTLDIGVFNIF